MIIDVSEFLKEIKNRDPHLGILLESVVDGLKGISMHAGINPRGKVEPPAPHQALNIAAGTDHVHVTITDNSPVKKNVEHFIEYSVNDPSFANAHVEHLGASRGRVLALPAKDGAGAPLSYYFKSYGQYSGSDAQSKHTFFGSKFAPTAVTLTGSSKLTLLPSTGSGTGKSDGSQSGSGLGTVLERPPVGPKRSPAPPAAL
jgi:hypothetical protein